MERSHAIRVLAGHIPCAVGVVENGHRRVLANDVEDLQPLLVAGVDDAEILFVLKLVHVTCDELGSVPEGGLFLEGARAAPEQQRALAGELVPLRARRRGRASAAALAALREEGAQFRIRVDAIAAIEGSVVVGLRCLAPAEERLLAGGRGGASAPRAGAAEGALGGVEEVLEAVQGAGAGLRPPADGGDLRDVHRLPKRFAPPLRDIDSAWCRRIGAASIVTPLRRAACGATGSFWACVAGAG
mmetsp:Transcript_129597/g.415559  ORF Transcript_129597/g.415559 Transcript_129597/m.415559 type:complete len:244 (-) Transcript_129597:4323-5054(-)